MTKHDEARRAFLVGAAVGAGAVATGAGLVVDAEAQTHAQHKGNGAAPAHANGSGLGTFLNADDAATVAAFTERLWPGAPGKPGAREVGVSNYIDLALAGAYSDLQDFYRRGLAALDAHCQKTYQAPFVRLSPARQDEVMCMQQDAVNKRNGRPLFRASPHVDLLLLPPCLQLYHRRFGRPHQ